MKSQPIRIFSFIALAAALALPATAHAKDKNRNDFDGSWLNHEGHTFEITQYGKEAMYARDVEAGITYDLAVDNGDGDPQGALPEAYLRGLHDRNINGRKVTVLQSATYGSKIHVGNSGSRITTKFIAELNLTGPANLFLSDDYFVTVAATGAAFVPKKDLNLSTRCELQARPRPLTVQLSGFKVLRAERKNTVKSAIFHVLAAYGIAGALEKLTYSETLTEVVKVEEFALRTGCEKLEPETAPKLTLPNTTSSSAAADAATIREVK